jgi:protein-tyrosine phosphatase
MIDIHNHMLPAVDDGARDSKISLAMLQEAVAQGVEHLVLTPHLYEADIVSGTGEWKDKITKAGKIVQSQIDDHGLPLKITIAAEVRYQDLLPIILQELNVVIGGKYLLLEFPFQYVPNNVERIVYDILSQGIIPIIAHPERIKPWQKDPTKLEALLNMGCPMQLDIGSFLGHLGPSSEKLSRFLLDQHAVQLVGSDSHGMTKRPLYTKVGYDWLSTTYSTDYADLLLKENPSKILAGKPVYVFPVNLDPVPLSFTEKLLKIFNR